jgi:hypothetical protein
VLKIVSALLRHLPAGLRYKILFMQRDLSEVLASQRVMLVRRGKATSPAEDARMADLFDKHLREVERVLAARTDVEVLYVRYDAVLRDAHRVARDVATFLGAGLDAERMAAAVEPALYRQRSDLEPRE